jgi:hypothetical protein
MQEPCICIFNLAWFVDIAFWKNRKNMEGLSVRSIFLNLFFQTVILLYLFDSDTSKVVLFSSTIGLLIEVWKIKKVFIVTVSSSHGSYY